MYGLLTKVFTGVVVGGGSALGAAVGVGSALGAAYKNVTKDTIKEEVIEKTKVKNPEVIEKMILAQIKEKHIYSLDEIDEWFAEDSILEEVAKYNNEVITVEVLYQRNELLTEVQIYGDEISSDIHVGDKIILRDEI